MPELPEVEVVRRGLAAHAVGRTVADVEVLHPRPVRRQAGGADELVARLRGRTTTAAVRRGKFLWLELDDRQALLTHLGMSGQVLVQDPDAPAERHLRVRIAFTEGSRELRFVDQRMFGGMTVVEAEPTRDGGPAGLAGPLGATHPSSTWIPVPVAHIARDPLDPALDEDALVRRVRARRTGVKRALLDQTLLSGVGNIYADEALWRTRLHYARPTETLTRPTVLALLGHVREVMTEALSQGGTSFDALYVDVNGQSGYFDRSLAVYGQEGRPCPRCGTLVRRDAFMNRSSFTCPRCQPRPRRARW